MTTTLDALLSRNISNVIAQNLVAKKETISSLLQKTDAELIALGLSANHISAIRDSNRPAIPVAVLRKVLDDSWRTCCVCHKPGRPIVVHHIKAWGNGGTHDEDNLVILCLEHHDEAHRIGGLSLKLTPDAIRTAKKKWISSSKKIRKSYEERLLNPHHRSTRWYWIHVDNLRDKTARSPSLGSNLSNEHINELKKNNFIDSNGNINPDSIWKECLGKPIKNYLFDSSEAQLMGIYISDLLGRFIDSSSVLDITEMLGDKDILENYLAVGSLIYFRHRLEIKKNFPLVQANIYKTDIHIEFHFNLWTSLNQTAHGIHTVANMAERSVVGEISSIGRKGDQLHICISPLGISPDFILHDPAQGSWVQGVNNSDYRARRKRAND
ncbi:HNH endonuclease signature motif containing protein [Aquitalea denitrificans]|uniref:HNH endonuclease signature motif containing protein n=1 Tax=Aquitalea denitrificans TaxID=519081 RepID=UPI00135AB44E|nr:HNH endonuclease signature motif containing protein [Aquitalea denitrificans]